MSQGHTARDPKSSNTVLPKHSFLHRAVNAACLGLLGDVPFELQWPDSPPQAEGTASEGTGSWACRGACPADGPGPGAFLTDRKEKQRQKLQKEYVPQDVPTRDPSSSAQG